MFIRFVIEELDRDSGRRQRLFQAAKSLKASGVLNALDEDHLADIRAWFNDKLARPSQLAASNRPHAKAQGISWFRDTAKEHIAKMREFQEVLERHGLRVEVLKADRLGYVLYEDEFQVVAYPFSDTPT